MLVAKAEVAGGAKRAATRGAALAACIVFASPAAASLYWGNPGCCVDTANADGTGLHGIPNTENTYGVAANDTFVYWLRAGKIARANLDGSNANLALVTPKSSQFGTFGLAVFGSHLYWTNGDGLNDSSISRADLDGLNVTDDFIHTGATAQAVAIDGTHIYWPNAAPVNSIGRANLDGSGATDAFISSGVDSPLGVAVDGAHVYWTSFGTHTIGRADLDGGHVDGSFISDPGIAYGVAVDGAHIYWTTNGGIGRANLDGSGVDTHFITGTDATSLFVDQNTPSCSIEFVDRSPPTEIAMLTGDRSEPPGTSYPVGGT